MNTKEQWEKKIDEIFSLADLLTGGAIKNKPGLKEVIKEFIIVTREQTKKEERERIYNHLLEDEELQFEILKIDDDTLGVMCERLGLTDNQLII
jgi:hypothetical protein